MKTSVSVRHYFDPNASPASNKQRIKVQNSPQHSTRGQYESHVQHTIQASPDSSLSSSFSSWPSSDSEVEVVKKVKRTVQVFDDGDLDRFPHLRHRKGNASWDNTTVHSENDIYTTITKQKKKTWTTVTELENGDVEEVTTTKIVTETFEPVEHMDAHQTPPRSRSRSVNHSAHSESGKLVSPSLHPRTVYSKAHYAPESGFGYSKSPAHRTSGSQSRSPSTQANHADERIYRDARSSPPPPESIILTTADISRRDSVLSKASGNASHHNESNNTSRQTEGMHSRSPAKQNKTPSLSSVSSIEDKQQPTQEEEKEQARGYGPQRSYSYASLYSGSLKDSRPVNNNSSEIPSSTEVVKQPSIAPQYSFVHPWVGRPQKNASTPPRYHFDPYVSAEMRSSPARSRSPSPSSQHIHGPGTSEVMCERCCNRNHAPLDGTPSVKNSNSPFRRLWSEGSLRMADRSTSPRSVSPTPSVATRHQPSYLSPTVSSLAKCTPEGLPHQVVLEPNPNPMPKDMIAADEPSHPTWKIEGQADGITNSRSSSAQPHSYSIPTSRANSRRGSIESARVAASIAGSFSTSRSRSPGHSVVATITPSRLGLPERQPRRQMVFVKDNVR